MEKVICIYNENGPSIDKVILEAFKKYLRYRIGKDMMKNENKLY